MSNIAFVNALTGEVMDPNGLTDFVVDTNEESVFWVLQMYNSIMQEVILIYRSEKPFDNEDKSMLDIHYKWFDVCHYSVKQCRDILHNECNAGEHKPWVCPIFMGRLPTCRVGCTAYHVKYVVYEEHPAYQHLDVRAKNTFIPKRCSDFLCKNYRSCPDTNCPFRHLCVPKPTCCKKELPGEETSCNDFLGCLYDHPVSGPYEHRVQLYQKGVQEDHMLRLAKTKYYQEVLSRQQEKYQQEYEESSSEVSSDAEYDLTEDQVGVLTAPIKEEMIANEYVYYEGEEYLDQVDPDFEDTDYPDEYPENSEDPSENLAGW